jgi:DUF4097 and DUF4098 domain-containing protein YvlB
MPTFSTPGPIVLTTEVGSGRVRVVASDRTSTDVEVRPSNPSRAADIAAAEQTRVEYGGGRLLVTGPKGWNFGRGGSIDVEVALPTDSEIRGVSGAGHLLATGRLGSCQHKTGAGDIDIETGRHLNLQTGAGDISVGSTTGHIQITTGTGRLRIGRVDGQAIIKNSNGDTSVGKMTGDLRVRMGNGTLTVDEAAGTVVAKTAHGDMRLGDLSSGAVTLQTGVGNIDVGIRTGVAAWLDLNTQVGTAQTSLEATAQPQRGEDAVEVRARSFHGDINVRHSLASVAG